MTAEDATGPQNSAEDTKSVGSSEVTGDQVQRKSAETIETKTAELTKNTQETVKTEDVVNAKDVEGKQKTIKESANTEEGVNEETQERSDAAVPAENDTPTETLGEADSPKDSGNADGDSSKNLHTSPLQSPTSSVGSQSTLARSQAPSAHDSRSASKSLNPKRPTHTSGSARRSRAVSIALSESVVNGEEAKSAMLFVQNALEKIKSSRDAKRMPALQQATTRVLSQFAEQPNTLPPPKLVLKPLSLVCTPPGTSNELKEVCLDTIGQLFSLSYFGVENDFHVQNALLSEAVNIVCDSWDAEGADQKVEMQIIKALTSAVVNENLVVHGSVLMRAVRQVYRIFVVTRSQVNQNLAQGSLTQMVQAVFERVKARCGIKDKQTGETDSENSDTYSEPAQSRGEDGVNSAGDALTLQVIQTMPVPDLDDNYTQGRSELEMITQDAGLLFRTLCRLSMKNIDESDVKFKQIRSKLLSLHLIHMILKHHISVFRNREVVVHKAKSESEPFALAIKPYLRQALAHNSLSPIAAAFEISSEIFWLILANLRSEFKPELAVFFTEVYFTVMDLRTATIHQRMYFMTLLSRICTDPRMLVELYLNYDCDPAAPNVFEKLTGLVSRLALKPVSEPVQPLAPGSRMSLDRQQIRVYDLNAPPTVAIAQLLSSPSTSQPAPATNQDYMRLKLAAIEAVVNILRSFVLWSQRKPDEYKPQDFKAEDSKADVGHDFRPEVSRHSFSESTSSIVSQDGDDPEQFASRKQNKRVLDSAILEFKMNPNQGLKRFLEGGLLSNIEDATEVAYLLLHTNGLDKAKLGDYLGNHSEFNQKVMVQFVNAMEFKSLSFVEALRRCLQRFRLPGEGQVVDRYMQTFAKKYYDDNSENGFHPDFASADSAWVLAMSVMMLNTDLHSSALRRRRMTDEQFIRNNKGMNDGIDFRSELLMDIYNEIQNNEIKLDSEQTQEALKDDAYDVASGAIVNRATEFFKSTTTPVEFADYYNASQIAHIKPMFELSWHAILAGIYSAFVHMQDELTLGICLEGLELALRISCHFDIPKARLTFSETLAQATMFRNVKDLNNRNLGALYTILRVALAEGDSMRDSWYDVLSVISRLEQTQLQVQADAATPAFIKDALLARELVVMVDRIFAETANMTNEGAVFFVKALAKVSFEEIGLKEPRLFALQKMVDVCYYNSARIRMGWSELWDAAMAEQFAKVLVDPNVQVVMFALDSLRQLSMRFLDIDEMPHFAFQREFLAPFGHALRHNRDKTIQVLVLECLTQIVLTRAEKLKSGWEAIFGAVASASDANPQVVEAAYSLLVAVPTENRIPTGFLEACSTISEQPEARTALKAVELLHKLAESHQNETQLLHRVLHCLSAIALQGKDLEVRGRCLEVLFKLLNEKGQQFERQDWDEVFTTSLSPLFNVLHSDFNSKSGARRTSARSPIRSPVRSPLRSPQRSPTHSPTRNSHRDGSPRRNGAVTPSKEVAASFNDLLEVPSLAPHSGVFSSPLSPQQSLNRSRSPSPSRQRSRAREELSLWLSSTLIQALKSLVQLFGTYFDMLEHALDPFFLELLRTCMLQENDPVSRMGSSCFNLIIHENVSRFTSEHWHLITSKIVQLFKDTTATQLVDHSIIDDESVNSVDISRRMTAKTVQALLLMSTVRELFVGSEEIFEAIPVAEILRITTRLRMSFEFAREFNHNNDLRHELYQRGFFRQTPNLLHQESEAARIYVSISMRLYKNKRQFETDPGARHDVREELMPFCALLLSDYNKLKENEPRHISKSLPIIESMLTHICYFEDADFKQCVPSIYMHVIDIIEKSMSPRLRESVQRILGRVAEVLIIPSDGEAKPDTE